MGGTITLWSSPLLATTAIGLALLIDAALGEPPRAHPLVGFGRYALWLEQRLARRGYHGGVIAAGLALLPPVIGCALLERAHALALPLDVLGLYVAIGHRSLRQHAWRVYRALLADDLPLARARVAQIVSRDTGAMGRTRVVVATIESVLENGNDALFAAVFWFALAGAPAALGYRLANTLDAMWGYRTARYRRFGWCAARLDDVLNFIPARLTALSYALVGHCGTALRCWHHQGSQWASPNAGPVMAAGAGALRVSLGGGEFYHGSWRERSILGLGADPQPEDISRALALLLRALALWLAVIAALAIALARVRSGS